uniref:PiggyBac transposable element-derived protein domain-containing protein n=1 Tax=Bactrocera latifrons TaxID=174628 RepID=A0A0K8V1V9_BACLA
MQKMHILCKGSCALVKQLILEEKNQSERVAKELAAPCRGSGRNICMDNFFTTVPVAKHLLSWNITIVVTKNAVESVFGHTLTETVVINPGPETAKDKTGRNKVPGSCHSRNALPIRRRRKTRKACANSHQPFCDETSVNRVQCVQCH